MCKNKYQNDCECEWIMKYKGTYTVKEIRLNKKLKKECQKSNIDFAAVEDLLKQGADPLGAVGVDDFDLAEHVYSELVISSQDSDSINLPKLTELFLSYGMNVDKPRIPYDSENSTNPLWSYTFVPNENAIKALNMLLINGLSADSFSEFWNHSMMDFIDIICGDHEDDEFWNQECTWSFKMLLLGASYDHILHNDKELKKFLCCSFNTNNIHIFRNWEDFEYHFDTSYCKEQPVLYGSIIHIYSKKTGEEVWKIGVGQAGRKTLKKLYKN